MSIYTLDIHIDFEEDEAWVFLIIVFVTIFVSLILALYANAKKDKSPYSQNNTWQEDNYNTALFRDKAINDNRKAKIDSSKEWRCSNCGRINQNYVGTCGCGKNKPKKGE